MAHTLVPGGSSASPCPQAPPGAMPRQSRERLCASGSATSPPPPLHPPAPWSPSPNLRALGPGGAAPPRRVRAGSARLPGAGMERESCLAVSTAAGKEKGGRDAAPRRVRRRGAVPVAPRGWRCPPRRALLLAGLPITPARASLALGRPQHVFD